jgi:hypothetical protein
MQFSFLLISVKVTRIEFCDNYTKERGGMSRGNGRFRQYPANPNSHHQFGAYGIVANDFV